MKYAVRMIKAACDVDDWPITQNNPSQYRLKRAAAWSHNDMENLMTIQRMDNVGIVVDDIKAAIEFFIELGLELEGEAQVEGPFVDQCVGLDGVRCDIAMMRTPDGHSALELAKYLSPTAIDADQKNTPHNTLGMHRVMFAVDDIDDVIARLRPLGGELVGEVAKYEDSYRLCYIRGPEGIFIGLAQQLG